MLERYFPLGIASGEAFLGREKEIKQLKSNVSNGVHTLIISPRRYGKTSLVKHVIESNKYPHAEIDFFVAQNEFSIEKKILKGIQEIIAQIDAPEKWLNVLVSFFKKAQKIWSIGIKGFKLEIIPEHHNDIPENILEALRALEYVLGKKKKKAILFIDEFQEIANIPISRSIEGVIRHFAQSSKHTVFIFSGSSQHLLRYMFDNKARPLYALCDQIKLNRLRPAVYNKYLNLISKRTWNKNLPELVFNKIIEVTECHPRYVYYLCMKLWDKAGSVKSLLTEKKVLEAWDKLIDDRLKDIRDIFFKKSLGQMKILTYIALGNTKELSGTKAQNKLEMSGSAIVQALKILEEEDLIEKADSRYQIIDPLIKATLIKYNSDYYQ